MPACDHATTSGQCVAILLSETGLMVMAAAHAIDLGPHAIGQDGVATLDRLLAFATDVEAAIAKLKTLVKAERSPIIKPGDLMQ